MAKPTRTTRRPRFRPTQADYFMFGGGLDLLTPAVKLPAGAAISALNYEPQIEGGYRRINGFERYDGHPSPSEAIYFTVGINLTGALDDGDTVTGQTSGATGRVLAVAAEVLVLGRVSGSFQAGENLQVSGLTEAVATTASALQGAASRELDAEYLYLAAEDLRQDILAVPGSGQVRGVFRYKGIVYAMRDNLGVTAGDMWKSTAAGWVQVPFGTEIQFTGAVGQIFDGDTITGLTSGATATVTRAMLRTGTWTVAGVGTLILSSVVGVFQNGEALRVGGVTKVTSSSLATAIARLPGGRVEAKLANFTGSASTKRIYGADGVNFGFEFDGTNYIPIRTGMAVDTPLHVAEHKYHLFFSFQASLQNSSPAAPYAWTAVTGAAEFATGDNITGILTQGGNSDTSSLAVFTQGRTYMLYGTSIANFKLISTVDDIGCYDYMAQPIGNDQLSLNNRGIQRLQTTLNYGNFLYASVSQKIQPLITASRGKQTESVSLRTRNQYRNYFSDGSVIVVGLTGDKISALMPLDYGLAVRCMWTEDDETEQDEQTFFGSDDGFVYQDNVGTSFDGADIPAWIRLSFNFQKNPRMRKQYRAAVVDLVSEGFSKIRVNYDLGYGTPEVAQGTGVIEQQLLAAGGYWDQFIWDEFTWDAQAVNNPRIAIDGIEKNISIVFFSERHQDDPHTLQGSNMLFTPTRLER